jgi:hypothetical protein
MSHRSSHFPWYRHSSSRPFFLGTYGRGQPLGCHLWPFKGLDKMEDGVSRMSWSSVRPCYITESRCWAQKEVILQRIFFVTGTSSRLSPTPLYAPLITAKLIHLRYFVSDMAYVAPLAPDETSKHFKRRLCNALHTLAMNASPTEMTIVNKFPCTAWKQVWKNLHASPVSDEIKST